MYQQHVICRIKAWVFASLNMAVNSVQHGFLCNDKQITKTQTKLQVYAFVVRRQVFLRQGSFEIKLVQMRGCISLYAFKLTSIICNRK